ncbi:MAG: hypothetical protein KDA65_11305 [Planctomycetaceae bacterium]|nr:hypothetical protein [Planctomycetaceae bacterium]
MTQQKGQKAKNVEGTLQRMRSLSKSMVEHCWQFPLLDYLYLAENDSSFSVPASGVKPGLYAKLAIVTLIELAVPVLKSDAAEVFKQLSIDERQSVDVHIRLWMTEVWNEYSPGDMPFSPLRLSLTKVGDIARVAGVPSVSDFANNETKYHERRDNAGRVQKRYRDREKQRAVLDAVWNAICNDPTLIFPEHREHAT